MKAIFLFATILSISLIACSKKDATDGVVSNPAPPIDTTVSSVIYTGNFQNGPYGTTSGVVKIVSTGGKYQLRLENFSVNSGPDLKVYLSKEKQPLNFYRLGALKALTGDQVYDIPGSPDFMEFQYAVIHCEKFNHLFGSALLMKK